jgi:hypothetical protein
MAVGPYDSVTVSNGLAHNLLLEPIRVVAALGFCPAMNVGSSKVVFFPHKTNMNKCIFSVVLLVVVLKRFKSNL